MKRKRKKRVSKTKKNNTAKQIIGLIVIGLLIAGVFALMYYTRPSSNSSEDEEETEDTNVTEIPLIQNLTKSDWISVKQALLCDTIGDEAFNETGVKYCLKNSTEMNEFDECIDDNMYYNITHAIGWGQDCFEIDEDCVCVE